MTKTEHALILIVSVLIFLAWLVFTWEDCNKSILQFILWLLPTLGMMWFLLIIIQNYRE